MKTTSGAGQYDRLVGPQRDLWNEFHAVFPSESELVAACLSLGAESVGTLSNEEVALAASSVKAATPAKSTLATLKQLVRDGLDPLGEAFCALRSAEERRVRGATYTPPKIVSAMVDWAAARATPQRVVDPGVGSARFLISAANAFPSAELVGIEVDPLAALMARANLAAAGHASRARIELGDFRSFSQPFAGRTLYIGNPPYVRHHQVALKWKDWLSSEAAKEGLTASKLAGLHIHFFLATARAARADDFGVFVTAAEWLDVNYGSLLRSLLLEKLGGHSVTVIEPTAKPFPDAATTAAITTFHVGAKPTSMVFRRVDQLSDLGRLGNGRKIHRDRLASETRWSHLTRSSEKPPAGYVELGELCRVHRGTVTGANGVWIAGDHSLGLPESVLFPTVTKAREVLDARGLISASSRLRSVIDLPADLDELSPEDRKSVEKFLKVARAMGACNGYIARHRKAWWAVGLRAPAPIISTYMARRPPGFAINEAHARHINIAHGLYPREPLSDIAKTTLVTYLQSNISQRSGRTYAGGLTKFEPREMERLAVPGLDLLADGLTA